MSDLSKINVNSTEYDLKDAKAYSTRDLAETTIDDADYIPFYDTSADAKKKTLWSNVKAKLKMYFDTLYNSGLAIDSDGEIAATYGTSPEETDPILKDETGGEIATVLNSIATELQLLGQPEVYAPVVYSTEEREVGVWTDGKPLYQKTVDTGLIPNNTTKTVAHNIANIETIVKYHGIALDSSGSNGREMPYAGFSNWNVSLYVNETDINIQTMQNWSSFPRSYVTIQYTKTTDVAGSGMYAALGVPAVHYSTNEHVIGTWIDGSTLYEKTVPTGGSVPSGATLIQRTVQTGYDTLQYTKP